MKTLYLLRHAKSDWDDPDINDHDRPLNKRGQRAASAIGRHLQASGEAPERVLCSTANRAADTLALVLAELEAKPEIESKRRLYHAADATLLEIIRAQPAETARLMLVGHNPGLQELACRLAGYGPHTSRQALTAKFPTAALAIISFTTTDWGEIRPGHGTLRALVLPRDLT